MGPQRLAWGNPDNLVGTSIPISQENAGKPMASADYHHMMTNRVMWMLVQEDDPQEAIAELVQNLEDRGAWDGPRSFPSTWAACLQLIANNPWWADLFQQSCPGGMPRGPVRQMPAAVDAIRTTTIWEWMDQAFASLSSLE